MDLLASLDKDGDGDIDSEEWAAGYAQLGKTAPGVPNPAVWYGTLPDGPAFKITQVSMNEMYKTASQLEKPGDATDAIDRVSSDERELRPPQLVVRMVELPPQVALELVDCSRRRRRRAEHGARGVPPFGGDGARAAAARRLDL